MHHDETHALPPVEAAIAGLLALMTGHSQSLLAGQAPIRRVLLGRRIEALFDVLVDHPQLSAEFRAVIGNLHRRWRDLGDCSAGALAEGPARDATPRHAAPAQLQ